MFNWNAKNARMEQKMSRQGISMWKQGRIQRKLRQIEDKTHTDDLSKLMKKEGSVEEPDQM